ncbi:hypothetical protein H310_10847 [Aphanomyces invadans]|uniref:G8 domain-containing protein n=1 Tax=Aphanomyces invadans TaxID=157072 RepID=A0A024TQ93_9STRA|nr:hypothetical protein H310_10847 [Aphanomyces invadans]ETV95791.1 hypothetical protein H310_10847 [Aphanomyces invadans]|eukprot:XP_008875542.1 hypothetical protein H310_10847 [Aphanomyces invadans]
MLAGRLLSATVALLLPLATIQPAEAQVVVVWENRTEAGNYVVPSGQTLVLRNSNTVRGQLTIEAGGAVTFDPTCDVTLQVGNVEIFGTLSIGSATSPYTRSAVLALACEKPALYAATDDRRYGINVREGGSVQLFGKKGTRVPWTKLAMTAVEGTTCITLADSTVNDEWAIGDSIVITTTDFDPTLTERRTITGFRSTCVEIDSPLQFMHYGAYTQGVDQRAEVGLLSRNIQLVGCTGSGVVGGHLKMSPNFRTAQLSGVEVRAFGQGDIIGRYPIHFHLTGNVAGTNSFVKASAIHCSYMRAITIHGTQSVLVERNVAYNITGHAMFLEDGAEFNNTFRGNLVAWVRQKTSGAFRLGSDALQGLSAYWITNPDNVFEDNVAAGVEGSGFWLHTRARAKLPSFRTGLYPTLAPHKTPLRKCTGNSAHSVWNAFRIDSVDFDQDDEPPQDYTGAPSLAYEPTALTVIANFTAHHARQGGWFRLFQVVLDNWNVADCREGIQFLTTGNTATMPINGTIRNSRFVGSSSNRGNLFVSAFQKVNYIEARSDSALLLADVMQMAVTLYDGPHYIENTTFENYMSYPCFNYYSTALGARAFNTFMMASTTQSTSNRFINTPFPVFVYDRVSDGGKTTLILDSDGSISGQRNAVIAPDWDFYYTPSCVRNAGYGLACPQRYNNIEVVQVDGDATNLAKYGELFVTRANLASRSGGATAPGLSFQGQYIPAAGGYLYHPSLSVGATYVMGFTSRTPPILRLNIVNGQQGDIHTVAICYPRGTTIASVMNVANQPLARAQSIVDRTCVNCFFYDTATDLLVLRLMQRMPRSEPTFPCPTSGCDGVVVRAAFRTALASTAVTDCTTRGTAMQTLDDAWVRTSFSTKETFSLDMPINLDWCQIGDPCLEGIDVGNREQGILAYSDFPCHGIGCYTNKCRYCKLSFSPSGQPFLPCPFESRRAAGSTTSPLLATTRAPVTSDACASFVSVGDAAVGISAMSDLACSVDNNRTGCFLSRCRFCLAWDTPLSRVFAPCSTEAPTCASLVSSGDQAVGISAMRDPKCPNSVLAGCFADKCRYCQTRTTSQSWRFSRCDIPMPATPTTAPTVPFTTLSRPTTPSTPQATATPVSTTGRPTTTTPPPSTPVVEPPVVTSSCASLVSDGDRSAGISAVFDSSCPNSILAGCFANRCRYCQTRTTSQSWRLGPCTVPSLVTTTPATTKAPTTTTTWPAATTVSLPSTTTVRPTTTTTVAPRYTIDTVTPPPAPLCSVSIGDANIGLGAYYDPTCAVGGLGCFAKICRFCRKTPVGQYVVCPPTVAIPKDVSQSVQSDGAVALAATTTKSTDTTTATTSSPGLSTSESATGVAVLVALSAVLALLVKEDHRRRRQQEAATVAIPSILTLDATATNDTSATAASDVVPLDNGDDIGSVLDVAPGDDNLL